jgi:hypothetical protein
MFLGAGTLAVALVVFAVAACGSDSQTPSTESSRVAARVEKCVDGFLRRLPSQNSADASAEELRRYVENTYCMRFARSGWVHDDGTLKIAAHTSLEVSEECIGGVTGGSTRTVPCSELETRDAPQIIDCALLHHVRRSEVQRYVGKLRREGAVECDDGTPLRQLGTP